MNDTTTTTGPGAADRASGATRGDAAGENSRAERDTADGPASPALSLSRPSRAPIVEGPLTPTDPRVTDFLVAWHENGRARFERDNRIRVDGAWVPGTLVYDDYYRKTAHERRKYLALDYGDGLSRSGRFLVDKATGEVYSIKGYGAPNRRLGTLAELTEKYRAATAAGNEVGR